MIHLDARLSTRTSIHRALLFWLMLIMLAACTDGISSGTGEEAPLLVAAAASLERAFTEIGEAYTAQTGQPVDFVFGSSGNLATQIENGAPFDLFASADEAFVERLSARDLVLPDTQAVYAQGRLVLAVNRESGLVVDSIDALTDSHVQHIAIANPELAPYGMAAREALQELGVWEDVEPKIVQGANVRQALQYVQTGDAPVGLVALSIADVPEVTYTLVDPDLHAPLSQAMAVVASTEREEATRDFAAFVLGPAGQTILSRHGFTIPETS